MHLGNRFTKQQELFMDCLSTMRTGELHECFDKDIAQQESCAQSLEAIQKTVHISMLNRIDSSSQGHTLKKRDKAGTKEKDQITKCKKLSIAEDRKQSQRYIHLDQNEE